MNPACGLCGRGIEDHNGRVCPSSKWTKPKIRIDLDALLTEMDDNGWTESACEYVRKAVENYAEQGGKL